MSETDHRRFDNAIQHQQKPSVPAERTNPAGRWKCCMNAEYAGSNALGTAKCKRSVAPQHLLFVGVARITPVKF